MKKQLVMISCLIGLLCIPSPAFAIRILVTLGNRVQEIDTETRSVDWEYVDPEVLRLDSADRLPNGNTLISKERKVFEVNKQGEIIWERAVEKEVDFVNYFFDAQRLANGDTLTSGQRFPSFDPEGRSVGVVWQYNLAGQLVWTYSSTLAFGFGEADRLLNGNTLLSSEGVRAIMEIDPNRNIVWSYNDNNHLAVSLDADRLPNGNTLICAVDNDSVSRVREVAPSGATVWEYAKAGVASPDADRLPNGNTFIAETSAFMNPPDGRIFLLNPANETLWQYMAPYPPWDLDTIAPANLAASAGSGKIVLDWDDYNVGGKTTYNVYRSTVRGGPYTFLSSIIESTYSDTTVKSGIRYYYVVTAASDPGLESGYSNEATALLRSSGGGGGIRKISAE